MAEEINRCTGHCCKKFTLQHTPNKLKLLFIGKGKANYDGGDHQFDSKKVQQIFLMVKFLGMQKTDPATNDELINEVPVYSCRNFNTVTNNCDIYEHRPKICRDYPNGIKCRYTGCTRTVKKEPRDHELYEKENVR
jgi:Fe-S-cluster containining protein